MQPRYVAACRDNQCWDPDWRRRHKGADTSPEDQLWRAAQAAVEIADALHELRH